MLTQDLIRRLPKAELHVHLDGSVRPETLLELAQQQNLKLPATNVAELAHYMHVTDARNLVDYLARFEVTLSVMQTPDALERCTYELIADGAAENVRYMEIRYSPVLNTRGGMPLTEAVEAPLRGMKRAEQEFGVPAGSSHPVLDGPADEVPPESNELGRPSSVDKELDDPLAHMDRP